MAGYGATLQTTNDMTFTMASERREKRFVRFVVCS